MSSRYYYPPYISVAKKRAMAEKKIKALKKKNSNLKPVIIEGRTIAKNWWGISWNKNLERYADFENRIGRGRSYARNGSVLDLQISEENITALVQGSRSSPYKIKISIQKLSKSCWKDLCNSCQGSIDSLADLLSGKFPKALQELLFDRKNGLFPNPKEIKFDCNCPDWASMCKHIAAVLYGVGARLDEDPSLFFILRSVKVEDLISKAVFQRTSALIEKADTASSNILEETDLESLFGIDLDTTATVKPKLKKESIKKTSIKPQPSMLDSLLKVLSRAKKGTSSEELLKKLNWTNVQLQNTISRAKSKKLVESCGIGRYRRL